MSMRRVDRWRPRRGRGVLLVGALGVLLLLSACSPAWPEPSPGPAEAADVIATPGATPVPTATSSPVNVQVVAAPRVAENENPKPVDGELRFTRGQWATVLGASGEPVGRFTVTGVVFGVKCLAEDAPKAKGSYVAIQLQVEGYGALGAEHGGGGYGPVFGLNELQLFEKNSESRLGGAIAEDCMEGSVEQREYGVGEESGYLVFDVPKKKFDVVWEYGEQTFRYVNLMQ
ncbi:hypothetical protein C5E10_10330 [Pseudoclavibacter sp. RFBG4]|nr:hypothetical protein C5E10_10330 [Pseudoclavibacter sp. RFBG4]